MDIYVILIVMGSAIIPILLGLWLKRDHYVYEVFCKELDEETKKKISVIKGKFAYIDLGTKTIRIYRKNNEWYYSDNEQEEQRIQFNEKNFSPNINTLQPEIYIKKEKKRSINYRLLVYALPVYLLLGCLVASWHVSFQKESGGQKANELPGDPQYAQDETRNSIEEVIKKNNTSYEINIPWNEYKNIESSKERRVIKKEKQTTYGINVSYYQQDIDWKKVAEQGIQYAIIRIGYRGYENGKISEDPNYKKYMKGAKEAGINIGTYFFSQATSKEEIDEEVEFMLKNMEGYSVTYPVGISLGRKAEEAGVVYRTANLNDEEYCNLLKYYCIKMKKAGYIPVIYFSSEEEYKELEPQLLQGYPLWMTNMTRKLENTEGVLIWQYWNYIYLEGVEKKVGCSSCGMDWLQEKNK